MNTTGPSDYRYDVEKDSTKDSADFTNRGSYQSEKADPALPASVDTHANMFSEGGKNYRTLGRWDTAIILITNEVGLGILSLPAALQTLGVVPGVIAIIGIGLLSTYTAYELLQYYRRYPFCVNIVDMAKVLGGLPLEIATGIGLLIKLCLTCASAGITMSIALNSMSDHGMCTVAFIAFPMIGCWLLCLPRTFKFVSQVGIPSTISIVSAILIVMISLGVSDPQNAPPGFEVEIAAVGHPGFKDGFTSCLNIAYAYAGNVGFVSIMAEQRDPSRDFLPALWILQCFAITLYVVVAVTVYCLAGQYTTSPSLGSAPLIPAKVAYGIVFPALLATGLCFGHTALKYLYVVCMRGLKSTNEVTANTVKSWSVWVGVTTIFWVVAFILANAIPIFSSILSISSATFIAWFTFGLSAVFWFHLNWGNLFMNWKKICLTIVNTLIIMIALFMNSAGLWAAITGLMETYEDNSNEISGAFTCADNGIL